MQGLRWSLDPRSKSKRSGQASVEIRDQINPTTNVNHHPSGSLLLQKVWRQPHTRAWVAGGIITLDKADGHVGDLSQEVLQPWRSCHWGVCSGKVTTFQWNDCFPVEDPWSSHYIAHVLLDASDQDFTSLFWSVDNLAHSRCFEWSRPSKI